MFFEKTLIKVPHCLNCGSETILTGQGCHFCHNCKGLVSIELKEDYIFKLSNLKKIFDEFFIEEDAIGCEGDDCALTIEDWQELKKRLGLL
jgi:hypothetical protein